MTSTTTRPVAGRDLLNKVPEVTVYFWIIKVLCTTVGETASDYLTDNVGLGLTNTTYITAALLLATLAAQLRVRRYVAPAYWLGIVLISVVGTQITDNLTDHHGVPLATTALVFSVVLAGVFASWYHSEGTLSIHTIVTSRREAFYWLAVLFTFALGTAAGDLTAERLALGYFLSAVLFAAAIAVVALCHYRLGLGAVTAFWLAYILTRPLGASLGDLLSQTRASGGLGLGTTVTSVVFLTAIVAVVAYLTVTRRDVTEEADQHPHVLHSHVARVLVVAHGRASSSGVLDAIRSRAARGPAHFHLLVRHAPTERAPSRASLAAWRVDAGDDLFAALPHVSAAAGRPAQGSVSTRPDAAEEIQETLRAEGYDEIILSAPSTAQLRDLAHRIAQLGVPLTTVPEV